MNPQVKPTPSPRPGTARITFGRPQDTNPEHVANVLIQFATGDYVRGLKIYRKSDKDGKKYILLVYPSYKNGNGSQKPFFRLSPERERRLVTSFLEAEKTNDFVEFYPLTREDSSIFSNIYPTR